MWWSPAIQLELPTQDRTTVGVLAAARAVVQVPIGEYYVRVTGVEGYKHADDTRESMTYIVQVASSDPDQHEDRKLYDAMWYGSRLSTHEPYNYTRLVLYLPRASDSLPIISLHFPKSFDAPHSAFMKRHAFPFFCDTPFNQKLIGQGDGQCFVYLCREEPHTREARKAKEAQANADADAADLLEYQNRPASPMSWQDMLQIERRDARLAEAGAPAESTDPAILIDSADVSDDAAGQVDASIELAVEIANELSGSREKRCASFPGKLACELKMRKLTAAAGGAAAGGAAAGGAATGGAAAGGAAAEGAAAEDAADAASSEGSPFGGFEGHGGALDSGVDSETSDDDGRF